METFDTVWMIKKIPSADSGVRSESSFVSYYTPDGTYLISWTLIFVIMIATGIGILLRSWGER
jgi:hypothetical protein